MLTVRRVKLVPIDIFHENITVSEEKKVKLFDPRGSHEQGVFNKKDLDESEPGKPRDIESVSHTPLPVCLGAEPKLRIKNRQSETVTRPHSWHSSKFLQSIASPSMMQISQGTIGSPWHQTYHSSSSTSDLSGFDHGYLRRSPEQYRSRSSMESLDHLSPAFHHCHPLSAAKSTNCIDQLAHLHSKRDSAYSSFSTNSSIPEYQPSSFSKERSYSMESMQSQNNLQEGIKHADIRYIKTVYDAQRGVSEEYEVNSSSFKNRGYSRLSSNTSGPSSRLDQSRVVSESDGLQRGPPLPPTRSDSYAVTRHHERPSSWSSTDQNRSFRTHSKATGSHPSSGTSQQLKPIFGEGQLHTVLEKSPESSPRTKPKQMYLQAPTPGQPMLPTGIYPVPPPEPHFAHTPPPPKSNNGRLYPALAKEGAYSPRPVCVGKIASSSQVDNNENESGDLHNTNNVIYLTNSPAKEQNKKQDGTADFAHYKLHFPADPEIPKGSSKYIDNNLNVSQTNQYVRSSNQQSTNGTRMTTKNQTYITNHSKVESVTAENRISPEVPLLNEWNELKTKQDISKSVITPGSCRNEHNTHTLKDKHPGNLYITTPFNNRPDDRPRQQDHKNKLDSPSFTKLIEDTDSSAVLYNNQLMFEEPSSPSQTKNCDFTRRRLSSGSTQSCHNVQYGKADLNKPRSLVLEKISKIEQKEQENHRNLVPAGTLYGHQSGQSTRGSNNRGSVNSIEELRNKFNSQEQNHCTERQRFSSFHDTEKISGVQQLKRTGSVYSIRSSESHKPAADSNVDKTQQYKHEQCLVQAVSDDNKRKVDAQTMPNKDDHWKAASQDTLGFSRAYRNSIKDAQSKVLEATSYRRRDLEISPPQYQKPEKNIKRPTSALLQDKISPVSPHAPKERHSITPTNICSKSEDVQSQENRGSTLSVARIGARRRLTAEQKKRSYSEPEKMNEVGASENEKSLQRVQKRGQNLNFLENTVADRRRVFERDGKACSTVNLSKPELKQMQQNALADYMARKTGRRPSSQEIGMLKQRSQSTYFSENMMESQSNSSFSSMSSLQEHTSYRTRDINPGRVSSTLPPGLTGLFDLASLEQDAGRQDSRGRSSSFANQKVLDYRTKSEFIMCKQTCNYKESASSKAAEFRERAVERKPGKSASAEDLLDTSQQTTVHHARSRSTPASNKISQDVANRQEVDVKRTSHGAVGQCISILKNKDGFPTEKRSFSSTLQSHPEPNTGVAGGNQAPHINIMANQSTLQPDRHSQHARTQSLTPGYGMHSKTHESWSMTLPVLNQSSPSKRNQVSNNHTTQDYITAEEYLYAGENDKICAPPVVGKDELPMDSRVHDHKSLEDLSDKMRSMKFTSPQRPHPSKIKWTSSNDGTLSQEITSCPSFEKKLSPGWNNNGMWSTSSSETDTPPHHGKISLRISESCLQQSAPVIGQDYEDDEVFVKEPETIAFHKEPVIILPSPSSVLQNDSVEEKTEKCLLVPNLSHCDHETQTNKTTQPKEVNKRHPVTGNKKAKASRNTESSTSIISTNTPIKNILPLIKPSNSEEVSQTIASTGETARNYGEDMPPPPEDMSLYGSQSLENDVSAYESLGTSTSYKTTILSPEDIKSQELAKEIVNRDQSLADILDPESKMKTTMDLMNGLFTKSSTALHDNNIKWKSERMIQDRNISAENARKEDKTKNTQKDSEYSSISASKVELQKIKDTEALSSKEENIDVNEKKAELIANINHKLEILKDTKESLLLDIKINNSLGEEVETLIESLCKPNEYDKYKMFIGDLDKVVNLLLSLSGRLARVENVLSSLDKDTCAEERKTWNEKKKQLCGQHEDARELKENLDRRERLVMDILGNYLTGEQFHEYQHFVKMKSALLIKQRELDDKIKLGQEQLKCLLESLPSDFQIEGEVPSREGKISSPGNVNIPPPLTSSI